MPLSNEERSAFLAMLPLLDSDDRGEGVEAMVRDHWRACLDEVGAQPGFDKVRAGLIRVFRTRLASDGDVRAALGRAVDAVRAFPEQVADGDATLLLARHPAWVGLCALELAEWDPSLHPDPVAWSILLAGAGFTVLGGKSGTGRGEVLWALAEEALGVGWRQRGRSLMRLAAEGPFADSDHAVQVALLLGLSLAEEGAPDAVEVLEGVARSHLADAHTATHARHVLAELMVDGGDVDAARYWLTEALESVDPDEDPSIAERLAAELAALDEDADPDEDTAEVMAPAIEF